MLGKLSKLNYRETLEMYNILQISIRLGKEMTPLVGKYLSACFVGIKDRNATVRKYYASAIGHLIGIAKVSLVFIVPCTCL